LQEWLYIRRDQAWRLGGVAPAKAGGDNLPEGVSVSAAVMTERPMEDTERSDRGREDLPPLSETIVLREGMLAPQAGRVDASAMKGQAGRDVEALPGGLRGGASTPRDQRRLAFCKALAVISW
jgi:hypothetical protein